jgi:hypothetical protein
VQAVPLSLELAQVQTLEALSLVRVAQGRELLLVLLPQDEAERRRVASEQPWRLLPWRPCLFRPVPPRLLRPRPYRGNVCELFQPPTDQ